jgi:hypothetical protein
LADARESGGERDIRDREIGRCQQGAGGLGAVSAGESERTGTEFRHEHATEVTRRVAEATREPGNSLTLDGAVGDQAHRPGGEIIAQVPLRRPRHGIRLAAFAGPEAGLVRGGRRAIEGDI